MVSDLNKLGIALKSLDAMKLGTVGVNLGNVEAYRVALKGLSVEQSVFALASKGATEEQIRQILVTNQATAEDVEAAMAKAGLTTATQALTQAEMVEMATKTGVAKATAEELLSKIGITATETGQIPVKKQVTRAMLEQAVASGTLTKAESAQIATMLGLNAVETTNIGITNVLTASFTKLWAVITAHPIGAILTAIGAVAVGAIAYINKTNKEAEEALVEAHENAKQALEDTKSSLSDDKAELQSVNSELETTKERLKEISSIGATSRSSTHSSSYFNVSSNGLLTAENALIYGTIYATDGEFSGTLKGCDGSFTGSMNVNNKFIVDANGNVKADGDLIATNANISGDVTATTLTANQSGSIAGWNFNSNAFYKNDINIGSKNGFYIGEDGISIGDYFVVDSNGSTLLNSNYQKAIYDSSINIDSIPIGKYGEIVVTLQDVKVGDLFNFSVEYSAYGSYSEIGSEHVRYGYFRNYMNGNIAINENSIAFESEWIDSVSFNDGECIINVNCWRLNEFRNYNNKNTTFYVTWDYNTPIKITQVRIIEEFGEVSEQIKSVHLYDNNTSQNSVIEGTIIQRLSGLVIDTPNKKIYGDNFEINTNNIIGYNDFSYRISNNYEDSAYIFSLNKSGIYHNGLATSSSGDNLIISSGNFYKKSSSSQRYKNSIQSIDNITNTSLLSPSNLYDIDVVTFKYNDDYLPETDQRYQKDITGFIAEDVYEKYPIACNLDSEGRPEMWDVNIMFPAALKLIQEQHEDIESLKEEVNILKETINNGEVS